MSITAPSRTIRPSDRRRGQDFRRHQRRAPRIRYGQSMLKGMAWRPAPSACSQNLSTSSGCMPLQATTGRASLQLLAGQNEHLQQSLAEEAEAWRIREGIRGEGIGPHRKVVCQREGPVRLLSGGSSRVRSLVATAVVVVPADRHGVSASGIRGGTPAGGLAFLAHREACNPPSVWVPPAGRKSGDPVDGLSLSAEPVDRLGCRPTR